MEIKPYEFCIFVASHISKSSRISYLIECLQSLIHQQMRIPIYLSISFENLELENECKLEFIKLNNICSFLNIIIQNEKTPQMKHYKFLLNMYGKNHKWIMFCDDDDTYSQERTYHFSYFIEKALLELENTETKLAGLYESLDKNHKLQRQEYWTYCVSTEIFQTFYNVLENYDDIINNKCCDVLFGEYLRRKENNFYFFQIKKRYYNYRVDENTDSITGYISSKQGNYTVNSTPPPKGTEERKEYEKNWESFIMENLHIFLHDTYLKTLVGYDFHKIMQTEFFDNSELLDSINGEPKERLTNLHNRLLEVCNQLYDTKL